MDFPVTAEFAASANAAQLHDEARGDSPEWPASFVQTDDEWVYRVDERDDVTIDARAVQAALDSHVPAAPPPDPDDALRAAIEAATDFGSLKAALLGSKPGQAARVAGRSKNGE